jgi:hypothetical protein
MQKTRHVGCPGVGHSGSDPGYLYGMNVLFSSRTVGDADRREFGSAELIVDEASDLFAGFGSGSETRVDEPRGQDGNLPRGWRG